MTDDRVQHYRLLHRLGAGGMGEVYLAEDPRLGRQLALKLLPAEFAQDANRRARFLTEARAAAALNHPNICTVYDAGETAEGRLFIALELLEGETLDVRLKGGPLEVTEVVRIGLQLASALEAAHAKGILHRDLKPANLHLDARGHLKVLDFGLAKRLGPEPGSAEDSTQWQTRTGGILGTPQYMSPEQALGKALDPRSDLFSCGAALYELLTGRGPFSGQTFAELMEQIVHRPPEAIARFNYAVPAELERVVLKCLQKDPDQRYQSARELAVDLRSVAEQNRSESVSDQPGTVQVVTWVLMGTNAEELERTVGVHETARILKDFQEELGREAA
jgi:serine/threonine protein kinase